MQEQALARVTVRQNLDHGLLLGPCFWPGAPDLAIEVISPNDTFSEVEEKVLDWLAAGCKMVIVLDPRKRTTSVYHGPNAKLLTAEDLLSGEDVVRRWSVAVRDLFG